MAGPLLQHVPPVTQGGPLVSSDGSPHPTARLPVALRSGRCLIPSRPIPSSLCPSRRSVGKSGPELPSSGSFCFVGRQQAACDQRQLRRFVLGQMLQRSPVPDADHTATATTSASAAITATIAMKAAAQEKYHPSLRALAIRENKIHAIAAFKLGHTWYARVLKGCDLKPVEAAA
jgi:hypothetical protein